MNRFFITLQYRGTNFYGWQTQPGGNTIQDELEAAFSLIFNEKIGIVGCGRTDSGVHASHYIAHFDTTKTIPCLLYTSPSPRDQRGSRMPSSA